MSGPDGFTGEFYQIVIRIYASNLKMLLKCFIIVLLSITPLISVNVYLINLDAGCICILIVIFS